MNWHPLTQAALNALAPIVVSLTAVVIARLFQWITSKVKNADLSAALGRFGGIVTLAVQEVEQTTIDAARAAAGDDKSLPKDVAAAALKAATDKVKAYTPDKDLALIAKVFGLDTPVDVEAFIVSHIEAFIQSKKA